jgi:GNAT superfamily N-acetyltransferase
VGAVKLRIITGIIPALFEILSIDGMSITISRVTGDDVEALVESVAGLFMEDGGRHDGFMDTGWPEREGAGYYAGLIGDESCLLVLARDGERVVGHLVGKLAEPGSLRTARFAILESIRVAPDERNEGVGTRLVAEFWAWARSHDAEQASVSAFAANTGAQRFYTRHGFTPHAITMRAPVR